MTAHDQQAPGPYAAAAFTYHRAGWSPLPLPAGAKAPVPEGWTGARGGTPSGADVHEWTEARGHGNVALRLPPHVIGVDVDSYGDKPGGLVLAALEAQLGELPPTWRTTSRDDGVSGIRLYRVPEGLRWPGGLGAGIDTIRHDHRYAVAWPSIHPNGGTYRWITPDGLVAAHDIPHPDDLPDLPDAWVQHFTGGELSSEQPHAGLDQLAAWGWLEERAEGQPCRHMETALARGLNDLASTHEGGRHDAALRLTNRLAWLAGEGHLGGAVALNAAAAAFLAAVAGDRRPGDAEAEWDRMLTGAVDIAAAAHPAPPSGDPCADPFAGLIAPTTRQETPPWPAATVPTPAPTGATPSTPSPSASSMPPSVVSSATVPTAGVSSSAPAVTATPSTPDEAYQLALRRHQAAQQEAERYRAMQAGRRLVETEDEAEALEDAVRRIATTEAAKVEHRRRTEPPAPPFDAGTLADVLARPDEPPMRADGLIPWNASTLLVAKRKTGKTTALLNYVRSLTTGEPFLGEFDVIALPDDARVAFLNYEVSGPQLARWANDVGIDGDRLVLVNLRGRRNPLGNVDDRNALAKYLREKNVQAVIVDPFGRAYTGTSQNDSGEVSAFLVGLDTFVRTDVGAMDLVLAAHAGWDGERSRGSSALEDWPDTIVTLTRDDEDEEGRRFMRAMGRDVEVDEDELVMEAGRRLVRAGTGSRKNVKGSREATQLAVYVVRAARENPGASQAKLADAIREMYDAPDLAKGQRGVAKVAAAALHAERQGRLRIDRDGPRGAHLHYEAAGIPDHLPPPPTTSGDGTSTTSTTSIGEVVRWSGGEGAPTGTGGGGRRTPMAGGRYLYDHTTGETIDAHTGEVATP